MTPVLPNSGEVAGLGMGGRLRSGASAEWWTPRHIFEALDLAFDLDPCGPVGGVPWIPAERTFAIEDDGLAQEWAGRVWLNPPYGRETPAWIDRLIDHGDGIALVFARVDAAWGQRALYAADAVCFIRGRLSFVDGHAVQRKGHNAANSSMLLAFGSECARAVVSSGLGWTCPPRPNTRGGSGAEPCDVCDSTGWVVTPTPRTEAMMEPCGAHSWQPMLRGSVQPVPSSVGRAARCELPKGHRGNHRAGETTWPFVPGDDQEAVPDAH